MVNALREKHGQAGEFKSPITINEFINSTNVFRRRTDACGQLDIRLSYANSVRDFPNYGLQVRSNSRIEPLDEVFHLHVDIVVGAAKRKWQLSEIADCVGIFQRSDLQIMLRYTCGEKVDSAGHSISLPFLGGLWSGSSQFFISKSQFIVEFD